ncbi:acyltransferase family protein [Pseudonocardia bannensis]|uniref:Acyltransferase n=1 Tax=Pseudonocardia bannensis TaxID=630973 RepID=A0A848DH72_9PSEU|nr:acyltransferase family protein [Pseudonocardia bannensis]NMH91916.1 acyltransferase [Pseudonocardia bannensis]
MSGFVLLLPFLSGRASWRCYYPKHLIRLYVPVWASLVFAKILTTVAPRLARPEQSHWINQHAPNPSAATLVRDALLLSNPSWLNNTLWSLRYEITFSLLLPLYILAAVKFRRWRIAKLLLLAATAVGSEFGTGPTLCLPMFGVGVVMTVERDTLAGCAARITRLGWLALIGASLVLLLAEWAPLTFSPQHLDVLVLLGASLLVFVFLDHSMARRFGDLRVQPVVGPPLVQSVSDAPLDRRVGRDAAEDRRHGDRADDRTAVVPGYRMGVLPPGRATDAISRIEGPPVGGSATRGAASATQHSCSRVGYRRRSYVTSLATAELRRHRCPGSVTVYPSSHATSGSSR